MRLFWGIDRHYRRLDFSLLNAAGEFLLKPYLRAIAGVMADYGCVLEALDLRREEYAGNKGCATDVLISCLLSFSWAQCYNWQRGMIRLGMSAAPQDGEGVVIQKQQFQGIGEIRLFDLPSICAEKYQELLCRSYDKGRDWYIIFRFAEENIEPNYRYLSAALNKSGPWKGQGLAIDREWLTAAVSSRLNSLDFDGAKRNICRFVKGEEYDRVVGWTQKTFGDRILSNFDFKKKNCLV
jgi:hypothetical protein